MTDWYSRPTMIELKESLFLQPRHACCDDATMCLRPPTRGTDNQFVDVQPGGKFLIDARSEWIFDIGDGGCAPVIRFCPFCGEELPR